MNEATPEQVMVLATPELLNEMETGWTNPVHIHIERPHNPGGFWQMTIRTVTDPAEQHTTKDPHT